MTAPIATAPPAEAPAADAKTSRKKLVLVLVAIVLLVAVGLLVVKPRLGGAAEAAPKPDPAHVAGAVVNLDPITLNLSDGRYLKAGLSLQLTEEATVEASGEGAEAAPPTAETFDGAKALDAAITVLGSRSYAQLLPPAGRSQALKALNREVAERYDGAVMHVYFTQFVMQ